MPKRVLPLSDVQVKNAKPGEKEYKVVDGFGLYLLVTPSGGKLWRLQYRFGGKQKLLSFGAYPAVSLADARQRREEARKLLASGVDPGELKKAQKVAQAEQETTFEMVARQWFARNEPDWSVGHAATVKSRLERDVFPAIGSRPLSEIKPSELRQLLENINARGVRETAYRIKVILGQVFRFAVARELAESDPSSSLKPKEILGKAKTKHFPSITNPKEIAPLLRAIDDYQGTFAVKCALQLSPLLFVRPGELQKAEWGEFDLDGAEWSIPAERMKMKQPHIVPLSRQAVDILKALQPLTGNGKYLFPGRTSARPMSNNTINAALRYLGYDKDTMTGHGFRAMARTILDEVLHQRVDYIEHQLAHAVKDPNGRAYNRTAHLTERRKMMQLWADYLDELRGNKFPS